MKLTQITLAAAISTLAISPTIMANSYDVNERQTSPQNMRDSSWATFSGEITKIDDNFFTMDYGDGNVTVSVGDMEFNKDAYSFGEGSNVTVTGKIDKTFFDQAMLNASTIYVASLNTTLFSSAMDTPDRIAYENSKLSPLGDDTVTLIGWVEDINALMNRISIDIGEQTVEVNLEMLGYDPLSDEGAVKLDVGNRVKVTTTIEEAILKDYKFDAKTLVVL